MKIRVYENLAEVEGVWRELFVNCAYRTPFLSFEWSECWWRCFSHFYKSRRASISLRIIVIYDSRGQVIGLAPFHRVRSGRGLTELRLMGDLGDYEGLTEVPVVLLHKDHREKTVNALLGYLSRDAYPSNDCDVVKMRWQIYKPLIVGSKSSLLCRNLVEAGRQITSLPETWEKFRGQLSQTMRKNLKYYPHRLTKHGFNWEIKIVTGEEGAKLAIEQLAKLHVLRSKSGRGPQHLNHFSSRFQIEFLRNVLLEMAQRNETAFGILFINNRPAAVQCLLLNGSEIVFYYSGFDSTWYDYAPLTIVSAALIKDAMNKGARRINFLFARAQWKQRWVAENETYLHMRYSVRPTLRSIFRVTRHAIAKRLLPSHFTERSQLRELAEELSAI